MRRAAAMAAVLVAGCVAGGEPADELGGDGKADGAGSADEACTTKYIEWLLLDFKPAVQAMPIDAARASELEALTEGAPCRGTTLDSGAFTTWLDVMNGAAFVPYFQQHAAAYVGFVMNGSPDKGKYDVYLSRTQPTEATKLALRVMQKARNPFVIDRFAMDQWLGLYHVMAEQVMHPLLDPALIAHVEGYWTINAGEDAMLDLLATTRPSGGRDGAYAAWVDEYGAILKDGVSIDDTDDYRAGDARVGCESEEVAPCGRAKFLDRFEKLAPTAHGDDDSMQWMWELNLWASLASTSTTLFIENDDAQLARVNGVRPAKLTGKEAYRVWLKAVADTATSSRGNVYADSVLPAKPCTDDGDAHYATFATENASLPAAVLEAAKPTACE